MNEYMKQAFALCGEQNVTVETIMQMFDDGAAFCRLWFENGDIDFPLNVDVNGFAAANRSVGDDIAFKLALFCKSEGDIYEDEEEYSKEHDGRFAPESIVPYGTMLQGGKQDCTVGVQGKITDVKNVDIDGVQSLHIRLACQGYVFDAFFDEGVLPFARMGNILCCVYDAIGMACGK